MFIRCRATRALRGLGEIIFSYLKRMHRVISGDKTYMRDLRRVRHFSKYIRVELNYFRNTRERVHSMSYFSLNGRIEMTGNRYLLNVIQFIRNCLDVG